VSKSNRRKHPESKMPKDHFGEYELMRAEIILYKRSDNMLSMVA
jgi:hypothetical protein